MRIETQVDAATGADPGVVSHVISAPDDADPFAEATVRACNPGVGGGLLDLDDLMAEAARARRIPAFEPSWRNLRLNQRCDPGVEGGLCHGRSGKQTAARSTKRRWQGGRASAGWT
jgi:hypothetical protein